MADWIRKRGTTAEPLVAILSDVNGPIDLPSGSSVTVRAMLPGAAAPKINASATIVAPGAVIGNADRGKVLYTLVDADLDTPGMYDVDWLVNNPSVGTAIFPKNGYMYLMVLDGANAV